MPTEHDPDAPDGRDGAREVIDAFFDLLGGGDVDTWLALLADDVSVDTPFAPDGDPQHFDGLDAVRTRFGDARRRMRDLQFLDIDVMATDRPGRWVVTCRSTGTFADGRSYQNRYCWLLDVTAGGQIGGWVEYFDPQEVLRARNPPAG